MKTIRHYKTARDKVLHIETEGGIVNIHVGLTDMQGRAVTAISILADDESRGGDGEQRIWHLADGSRLVRQAIWVCRRCQDRLTEAAVDGGSVFYGPDGGNICPDSPEDDYQPHEPVAT